MGDTMKKRMVSVLIAGGLLAAMLPGVAAAAAPNVTGSVYPMSAPGALEECGAKGGDYAGSPADVIPQTLARLRVVQAVVHCSGSWASVIINGHEIIFQ
jgi:hypothetical protein